MQSYFSKYMHVHSDIGATMSHCWTAGAHVCLADSAALHSHISAICPPITTNHLSHDRVLQRGDTAQPILSPQLRNARLLLRPLAAQQRHLGNVEPNLQPIRGGEARLDGLPDLLLGVEHALGLALPALEEDVVARLALRGGVDKLDGALVRVLAFFDLGAGGEHHGAGFDAAHGDGLEVADGDDLAVLHVGEGDEAVETGADGADDLAFVLGGVVGAGGVAAGDGGDEEGVGVGVGLRLQDVADAEVDEGGGEGLLDGGAGLVLAGVRTCR